MRNTKLLFIACIGFIASISLAFSRKPNVVFILVDDLGWKDTSLYGNTFYETPNIDALAKRGMKFNQAYSANPLCSPTRASILTGLLPARIGITLPECHLPEITLEKGLESQVPQNSKAISAKSITRLSTDYYTLAEAFQKDGYTTAHFGKWHLGPKPYSPLEQGFSLDVPHTNAPSPLGDGFFYPFHVWKKHGKPGDNLEDLLAEAAVKFIQANKDKPFFLNYWSFQPHSPWQAKESQINKYRAKVDPNSLHRNPVYAGMIETLDEAVGRIVTALDQAGILDETVIVFTSDNGPYFIANNEHMPEEFHEVPVSSSQPLRAGKGTIYQGGTRVPLVIVWPGKVKPGTTSEAFFQSTDFFPTFANMLSLDIPSGLKFDGINQKLTLETNQASRKELFCHFPHQPMMKARYEGMRVPTTIAPSSSLQIGDWKLIRFYCENEDQTDKLELYNVTTDPGESINLAASQPEKVKELSARLDQILKDTEAVIPQPNPNYVKGAKPNKK